LEKILREIVQSFEFEVRFGIETGDKVFDFRIEIRVSILKSESSSRRWNGTFGFCSGRYESLRTGITINLRGLLLELSVSVNEDHWE